jgi:hypothetical protein
MMMESKHMGVGDDVCGDDDGEDLEIPLPKVESKTNLTSKMKIVDVVVFCFTKGSVLMDL